MSLGGGVVNTIRISIDLVRNVIRSRGSGILAALRVPTGIQANGQRPDGRCVMNASHPEGRPARTQPNRGAVPWGTHTRPLQKERSVSPPATVAKVTSRR